MPGPYYFAWINEPAVPAFELLTTGDVWGGEVTTVGQLWGGQLNTNGDVLSGFLVSNLTATDGLVGGQEYLARGKGIPTSADGINADTYFTYDGVTGGTLSQPIAADAIGVSLILISAAGRNIVPISSVASLETGLTYGIAGGGISPETTFTFAGTNILTLSAPSDSTGQNVSLKITGIVGRDVIKNLGNTTGLVVGQSYDVFGPGIPTATSGVFNGTGLALTAEATVTNLGATMLLSRPASYPDGGPFDPAVHLRYDEFVTALVITHAENGFPTAVVDIRNPHIGLLASGRPVWVWLSWDSGAGGIKPLLHGRLLGAPTNLSREIVRLTFVARPEDYVAQKTALAATMRAEGPWDDVWLIQRADDPDTVLEARSELWHVDPRLLEVSTSDIITGEDGTLVVSNHAYDSLTVSYGAAPKRRINCTGTVTWTQEGEGDVDLTEMLWRAFANAGSATPFPVISTFTGNGLQTAFPTEGTGFGGGWSVGQDAQIMPASWVQTGRYGVRYTGPAAAAKPQQAVVTTSPTDNVAAFQTNWNNFLQIKPSGLTNPTTGALTTLGGITMPSAADVLNNPPVTYNVLFDLSLFLINLPVHYQASRSRSETIAFSLEADVQAVLTEAGAIEEETLALSSAFVAQPVDPGGALPIGDLRYNSYFPRDRGRQSLEYMLALCRAKLRSSARAVTLKFTVPWETVAPLLTCRWNVQVLDPRLPAGQATGKVTGIVLTARAGGFQAEVTIGCTIGYGVPVVAFEGADSYADDYADDYDQIIGGQTEYLPGELNYQSLDNITVVDDDGVDFFNLIPETVVQSLSVSGGPTEQWNAIESAGSLDAAGSPLIPKSPFYVPIFLHNTGTVAEVAPLNPLQALALTPTRVDLEMVPVTGGAFHSDFYVLTSRLVIPQTINLEAPSNA